MIFLKFLNRNLERYTLFFFFFWEIIGNFRNIIGPEFRKSNFFIWNSDSDPKNFENFGT